MPSKRLRDFIVDFIVLHCLSSLKDEKEKENQVKKMIKFEVNSIGKR